MKHASPSPAAPRAFLRRPPRASAGLGMLWVVLAVTFGFIGSLFGIFMWTDWKDHEARRIALEKEFDALGEERTIEVQRVEEILPPTGFKRAAETEAAPKDAPLAYLKDRRKEYLAAFQELRKFDRLQTLDTLRDVLEVATKDLDGVLKEQERNAREHERRKNLEPSVEPRKPLIDELSQARVAELDRNIQAAGEERGKIDAAFEQKRQQVEEETKKCVEEREAADAKHKTEMIRLENEISELKRRLEEVKRREVIRYDITEVHGEVVHHDVEGRFAFIDIGSEQRVVRGLRFHVAVPGDGGRKRYKGEVEVKIVWPRSSQVSVVALYDPEQPIIKGDQLVNPLFDTRRPKVLSFAGEPSSRLMKYPVNEAMRRILEIGSVVKPEATVDLDFLMTTEAYEGDRNFLRAVELQIPVASAADMLKFLGD